jgi:hypothetical protein
LTALLHVGTLAAMTEPAPQLDGSGLLDPLVIRLLGRSALRFTVADTPRDREMAYEIRYLTVVDRGWTFPTADVPGREIDAYDERALHVIGLDGNVAVTTGRIVLPPGLPTEDECGIVVEPAGRVVDVGRMCVRPGYPNRQGAFVSLLCRLYLEMRYRGYAVACGMMTPAARTLMRQLGLRLEVLGPDRSYWGEPRAPVRFETSRNAASISGQWSA